ncbi:MAG: hypothetical protein ABL893_05120 [Hyphomicrobium sp.]|nr:hypothetical protein [Hyphomicrobium sp.]
MPLKTLAKMTVHAAALGAALVLSGCGLDDIQLNGKIFDAVGMNNTGSVKKEAKMAERSPLVVPPGLDRLPEPGSAGAAQATAIPEIQDHDAKRQVSQADLEAKQEAYCKIHYEQAKAHGDNNADLAEGPMGPCRGSVMNVIKKVNGGSDGQ